MAKTVRSAELDRATERLLKALVRFFAKSKRTVVKTPMG
jgi:hypothetical protein